MKYGLIGEKLGHSFSAEIHKQLADYDYKLREVSREEFDGFMKARDFSAINVTIPYKQDVIPYLSYISDTAKQIGAVNTIVNKDGKLYGYNTDFSGMKALIQKNGIDLSGKRCSSQAAAAPPKPPLRWPPPSKRQRFTVCQERRGTGL